jgi:hypothetical protein
MNKSLQYLNQRSKSKSEIWGEVSLRTEERWVYVWQIGFIFKKHKYRNFYCMYIFKSICCICVVFISLIDLSHKTDHQHIARMQSEIYLVDMFRPETVVIRTWFCWIPFGIHLTVRIYSTLNFKVLVSSFYFVSLVWNQFKL